MADDYSEQDELLDEALRCDPEASGYDRRDTEHEQTSSAPLIVTCPECTEPCGKCTWGAGRRPPLECILCGLRCWNDQSVRWFTPSWGGEPEPWCVANGCAARRQRIAQRNHEAHKIDVGPSCDDLDCDHDSCFTTPHSVYTDAEKNRAFGRERTPGVRREHLGFLR